MNQAGPISYHRMTAPFLRTERLLAALSNTRKTGSVSGASPKEPKGSYVWRRAYAPVALKEENQCNFELS